MRAELDRVDGKPVLRLVKHADMKRHTVDVPISEEQAKKIKLGMDHHD